MQRPIFIIRTFIFGAFLCFLNAQDEPFVLDSSLSAVINQSLVNDIQVADVNNDGYNDIIYSGYDSSRFGLFIDIYLSSNEGTISQGYQTNFITYPDTIGEYIGGLGNIDLSDVNLDGYIDIYLNGSAKSKLLFNTSTGSFNESSWLQNMSISYSHGKWGDVNMDGRPDLFLMGVNEFSDNILNELYMNNGDYLEKDPSTIFPSLFTGSNSWGDFDNDGDPDLIIAGQTANPNSSVSRLYKNDPIGRLSEVTTVDAISGLKAGTTHFADLDADGDSDLIITGWNKIEGKLITRILENEPLGTFSQFQDQINFAVAYGTIDAIDYNLDGYIDFVIAGADSVSNYAGKVHALSAKVYENNRDGTFSLAQEIPGARSAKFVDLNQDGIPDLVASGTTEAGNDSTIFSKIYINTNSGSNNFPEPPSALNAFAVSTRAIFTWGSGSDDINNTASLSYNLRIGTSSGGNQLLSSSVPFNSSNVGQRLIREFNEIPHGTYYWAVQTVDGSGNLSTWSQEDTLFIPRLVPSIQSLPGVYYSSAGWADYNEDNIPDLALTGVTFSGTSITNLFENSGGLLSQDLTQNIEAVFGGHLSWVDYTNDGHLDLTMTGFQISNFFGGFKTSFYKWDNGIYIADTDSEIDIDLNYDGIGDNWVNGGVNGHHWGDYDNDGDLDYVQGGFDNYYRRHLDIFFNDDGILRLDTNQVHLIPINPAIVQWVDLDKDGNLDLVTIGADETETVMMRVYLNNANNIFTQGITWQSEIFGVTAGAIAFADYNADGYDDFALSGLNTSGELITYVAENNINTFIVAHILQGAYYGKPSWGDYDNDGDLDLLVTGQSSTQGDLGSSPITHIYKQIDNQFQLDQTISIDSVGISFSQWGDYDVDGDLDLFLSGFKENQDVVAQIYDNLEGIENPNKSPNAPYLLDDSNINNNTVTLTWNAPVDPENENSSFTPQMGLRYQLQVGSEDNNNNHAISTGAYGISEIGTFTKNQKILTNLGEGSYSWRVRAIDYGLATSNWSNKDYFYIDVTPPTIDTIRANYVTNNQIILVIKFKEDFYLNLNKEPTVLVTHPYNSDLGEIGSEDDSLLVTKQSFNGDEWTGVLLLPDYFSGKAIEVHVYGAQDGRENKMDRASIFKTPKSIISQYGGTAISEDGNVSVLLPQNAVNGDISVAITGQNVPSDTSSFLVDGGITYLISDLYDIKPFNQSLNKPGILRIGFPDSTCLITEPLNQYFNINCPNKISCDELNGEWIAIPDSGLAPFIGLIDTTITGLLPVIKLGGSQISIGDNSYMQVQIDTFGTYGAFISLDTTLVLDSLDIEKVVCQPRIFSPGGSGSVFEFTETNIIYSLAKEEDVTARIFNLSGRLKRVIKPQHTSKTGNQILNWDGKDSNGAIVPSGLYIVTLEKENTVLRTTVGVLNR
ncbi:MAG: FG-GAP-like repeat-containing protein [Candidatus Neomarinimicrobiota bacterium]